jgi:hypothetical protein
VADLWACFNGESYGEFHDIDKITMFADYRIPQMLHQLGCLLYSPSLEGHIRSKKLIPSGSNWEIELRATSIWCVELIRREIERQHPEVKKQKLFKRASVQSPGNGATSSENETDPATQKHIRQASTHDTSGSGINAILIDFFLYDTAKELERDGRETIPHHRTRSIWY